MLKKIKRNWANAEIKRFPAYNNVKPLIMCKSCYAFYYNNSWNINKPARLNDSLEEEVSIRLTKCGACLEEENAQFEKESNFILDSEQA